MSNQRNAISDEEAERFNTWQAPLVEGPISAKVGEVSSGPPTAGALQALHKEAYDEGFALGRKEGKTAGYNEGIAEARQKLEQQEQQLTQLLNKLAEPLEKLDEEVEHNLVELTIQIARHLVRREFKIEPGEIVAVVRGALSALPVSARNPRIYLHPEDAVLVRNALSVSEEDSSWRIEEDLLMMRGDCRVETESSLIDASIEAKLSAIAARLLGGERGSDVDT